MYRICVVSVLILCLPGGIGMPTAYCENDMGNGRYFSENLLHATWLKFPAEGYEYPVTGVIYRNIPRPTCGMPLGGIDTGCIDIDPNGMLGYSTLFNHLIDPRLLYNLPFLGLSVNGKTWVLATDTKGKKDRPIASGQTLFPPTDYTPTYYDIGLKDVNLANSIDYWGHYPIVDMEFKTDSPVQAGMRAWSPFLPGDTKTSLMPGAVFECRIRNNSTDQQQVTLAFTFPGFETPTQNTPVIRQEMTSDLTGLHVSQQETKNGWEMSYVLGVMGDGKVRIGGPLKADGAAWNKLATMLPVANPAETGMTIACDSTLKPGEIMIKRFVFSWYAPQWKAGGAPAHVDTNTFKHMYAKYYPGPVEVANELFENYKPLLERVIAWQKVLYNDPDLPGWLADSLINNLHLITECGVWGQAEKPIGDWCKPEDGLFGLNECPRGCPQIECIPCSFYGNMPLVYFFPEAALSTLRGYKAYQLDDGRPPWIFGGCTANDGAHKQPYDLVTPDKGYQTVLNAACYLVMADRYWQRMGDDAFLNEFWDSLKRANDFSMNLRPKYGASQVMSMPEPGTDGGGLGDTEWFEAPEPGWKGYVTHAGAVRMAQVAIAKRMAEAMKDEEYVKKCDEWLKSGEEALEKYLWNGTYYLNFNDVDNKVKSDLIFGYQLDGEWITDTHGVPGVFPKDKVGITLQTIRKTNCVLSQTGATNYANADGTSAKVGGYGTYSYFPPELMMLAMTYIYEGDKEFGLDLLYRSMKNISCDWGYTWDLPNVIRGDLDTGQRQFGADYYQNMMLWFVPSALKHQDIKTSSKTGNLIEKVIQAAKTGKP